MAISGSLNFITASEFGSYLKPGTDANRRFGLDKSSDLLDGSTRNGFIPTDFLGLNMNIQEPFDLESSVLGHDSSYSIMSYVNAAEGGNDTTADGSAQGFGGFIHINYSADEVSGGGIGASSAYVFNALMLNRNGPYQRPMWQQSRGGNHPIAKYLRMHNTMSISNNSPWNMKEIPQKSYKWGKWAEHDSASEADFADDVLLGTINTNFHTTVKYYEPAVVSGHFPLIYNVAVGRAPGWEDDPHGKGAVARQTLFNNLTFFTNPGLNDKLFVSNADPAHDKRPYKYFRAAAESLQASQYKFRERIFPREINTYRPTTRAKTLYEETAGHGFNGYDRVSHRSFWRDNIADRSRTDEAKGSEGCLNSQGYSQKIAQHDYIARSGSTSNNLQDYMCSNQYFMTGSSPFVGAGIVTFQRESERVKYPAATSGSSPSADIFGRQLEMYQPYQISLNSRWPLDCRSDIYTRPDYLSAVHNSGTAQNDPSVGIGVSPLAPSALMSSRSYAEAVTASISRSAGELVYSTKPTILYYLQQVNGTEFIHEGAVYVSSSTAGYPLQFGASPNGLAYARISGSRHVNGEVTIYGADGNTGGDTHTGGLKFGATSKSSQGSIDANAGATFSGFHGHNMNFYGTSSIDGNVNLRDGYHAATASLQFLRHAYPYQTPYWATHLISGRNPMYDSYADFSEDLYYLGKEYSIVPEFRFSEHFDYYAVELGIGTKAEKDTIFKVHQHDDKSVIVRSIGSKVRPKLDFLGIDGVDLIQKGATKAFSSGPQEKYEDSTESYSLDDMDYSTPVVTVSSDKSYKAYPQSVEFHGKYTQTDTSKHFSYLTNQGGLGFKDDVNTSPSKITLKLSGIKKLLPYNGFYPVNRTVQIGTYLSQAFGPYMTSSANDDIGTTFDHGAYWMQSSGSVQAGRLQAFLEPLMAPGMLYNSIKSGIAVNHPIYKSHNKGAPTGIMKYFGPREPYYLPAYTSASGPEQGRMVATGLGTDNQKVNMINAYGYSNLHTKIAPELVYSVEGSKYGPGIRPDISGTVTYYEDLTHERSHNLHFHVEHLGMGGGSMLGVASACPTFLKTSASFKMPFEALYHPRLLKRAFLTEADGGIFNSTYLTHDFIEESRAVGIGDQGDGLTITTVNVGGKPGGPYDAVYTYLGEPTRFSSGGGRSGRSEWSPRWSPDCSITEDAFKNSNLALVRYKSAINNFLSETMDFFLEGGTAKFPVLHSDAIYGGVDIGNQTLSMDILLRQGTDNIMCEGPRKSSWQSDYGHKHIKSPNEGLNRIAESHGSLRGYLYGPPVEHLPAIKLEEQNWRYTYVPDVFDLSTNSNNDEIWITTDMRGRDGSVQVGPVLLGGGSLFGNWMVYKLVDTLGSPSDQYEVHVKRGTAAETTLRVVDAINGVPNANVVYHADANGSDNSIPNVVTLKDIDPGEGSIWQEQVLIDYSGIYSGSLGFLATTGSGKTSNLSADTSISIFAANASAVLRSYIGGHGGHAEKGLPYLGFAQNTGDGSGGTSGNQLFRSASVTDDWVSGGTHASHGVHPVDGGLFWDDGHVEQHRGAQYPSWDGDLTHPGSRLANSSSVELFYNYQDPAYQAYTPPYFYGASRAVVQFVPDNQEQDASNTYTLSEILANTKKNSFYFEEYDSSLCPMLPTTGSVSSGSMNRMKIEASVDVWNDFNGEENIYKFTPADGSDDEGEVWWMAPKWVCPVLDMSEDTIPYRRVKKYKELDGEGDFLHTGKVTEMDKIVCSDTAADRDVPRYFGEKTGRSIWMGYGYDPYDQEMLEHIGAEEKDKGIIFGCEDTNPGGLGDQQDTPGFKTDIDSNTAYATMRSSAVGGINEEMSLRAKLNFGQDIEKFLPVGQIGDAKLVSEAIVAIPYFEDEFHGILDFHQGSMYDGEIFGTTEIIPGKHFLKLWRPMFDRMLRVMTVDRYVKYTQAPGGISKEAAFAHYGTTPAQIGQVRNSDVGRMIQAFIGNSEALAPDTNEIEPFRYVIPPEMDFVHNAQIDPFQMVVVPFYQKLDKQDLLNIYQGVMPDCSMRASMDEMDYAINPNREHTDPDLFGAKTPGGVVDLSSYGLGNFLSTRVITGPPALENAVFTKSGNWPNTSAAFFKRLRWMVFKVKQRGNTNYDLYRRRHIENAILNNLELHPSELKNSQYRGKASTKVPQTTVEPTYFGELYGMNWPYDYFSLVEKLKVDIEYQVEE